MSAGVGSKKAGCCVPARCFLWALFVLVPCYGTAAAGQSSHDAKPAGAIGEQSPEQAAGGRDNLNRLRAACGEDAKRHCKGTMPGGGRIIKCLREHDSELTAECRQAMTAHPSKP